MSCLRIRVAPDAVIVRFSKRDLSDPTDSKQVATDLLESVQTSDRQVIVLNFTGVDMVSSKMIGEIVKLHKRCESINVALRLCCVGSQLKQALKSMALNKVLTICVTEDDALAGKRKKRFSLMSLFGR